VKQKNARNYHRIIDISESVRKEQPYLKNWQTVGQKLNCGKGSILGEIKIHIGRQEASEATPESASERADSSSFLRIPEKTLSTA
jgi:hypothetical protein